MSEMKPKKGGAVIRIQEVTVSGSDPVSGVIEEDSDEGSEGFAESLNECSTPKKAKPERVSVLGSIVRLCTLL